MKKRLISILIILAVVIGSGALIFGQNDWFVNKGRDICTFWGRPDTDFIWIKNIESKPQMGTCTFYISLIEGFSGSLSLDNLNLGVNRGDVTKNSQGMTDWDCLQEWCAEQRGELLGVYFDY